MCISSSNFWKRHIFWKDFLQESKPRSQEVESWQRTDHMSICMWGCANSVTPHQLEILSKKQLHITYPPWDWRENVDELVNFIQLGCISTEEQDWLKHCSDLLITLVLAQDVSRIVLPVKESKADVLGCYGFMHMVKWQCIVTFVKLGMGLGWTVNDSLVITKHVALLSDWDAEVAEGQPQVYNLIDTGTSSDNNLINTGMSCDIFTPISCSLYCCLFLCIPVDGHLVQEMKNTRDGTTCDHIMKQVSINVMWQCHKLAKQFGIILWGKFLYITIDTMGPLILVGWNLQIIQFFSRYNNLGTPSSWTGIHRYD